MSIFMESQSALTSRFMRFDGLPIDLSAALFLNGWYLGNWLGNSDDMFPPKMLIVLAKLTTDKQAMIKITQ